MVRNQPVESRESKGESDAKALLAEIVDFCRQHGGACYEGWTPQQLEQYVLFHMRQGTFAFVRILRRVVACAVIWQDNDSAIRHRVEQGQHPLGTPTQPTGDCLFLGEFICIRKDARRALLAHFERRFPSWQSLKLVTLRHRDGQWQFRRYRAGIIARWKGDHATGI